MTTSITGPTSPTDEFTKRGQPLTSRQVQVMELLVLGMNNGEIAKSMSISRKTVEMHVTNVMYKTGLGRRVLLALWFSKENIDGINSRMG